MNMIMKKFKIMLGLFACTSAFAFMNTDSSHGAETIAPLEPVRIYGNAVKEGNSRLHVTSNGPHALHPEIILTISPEHTLILEATTGLPVAYEDIADNSLIYAYVGPAMTMSLPPISNASIILCNVPADYKVPEYLKVSSLTWNESSTEAYLKATNSYTYTIPSDCVTLPYLTRNIVTIDDLTKDRYCLLWSDSQNRAHKIVIFAFSDTDS